MAKRIFAVIGKPEMIDDLYDIADAVADPHLQQREVLVDVEDDDLGSIPVHNIVPRLSGTPGVWRHQASFLGQHTDALLAPAGYTENDIARLYTDRAVARSGDTEASGRRLLEPGRAHASVSADRGSGFLTCDVSQG